MPSPAGLINLVSNLANGTRLQEQLALRGEYVDLFGRDAGRPLRSGLRGPAGLAFSYDVERLVEAIRERERPRRPAAARLQRVLGTFRERIQGTEPLLRTASAAVSAVVLFLNLAYSDGEPARKT